MKESILKQHLQALCEQHGGKLTPEIVLRSAAPESSPIHGLFEWDDTEAARKYRLLQASEIIRKVKVRVTVKENDVRTVRAYVNIENPADDALVDSRRVYVPVADALRKKSTREQVINALHREVIEWRRRAEAYEVFAEICRTIRTIGRKAK